MMVELTILVPVFNEQENLRLHLPLLGEAARSCSENHEILFIDDGSTDSSLALIEAARGDNPRIRLVRHARNLGPCSALPTGLFWARGQWIMLVPADLACEPEEIPLLWRAREGKDLVVALRSDRRDYSLLRKLLSWGYIGMLRGLTGSAVRQFNYLQLCRREVFSRLRLRSRGVFATAEIILRAERAGLALAQLPLTYRPRTAGLASGAGPRVLARCLMEMAAYLSGRQRG